MISSKKHQFSGDEFSPQLVTFCGHHFSWQQTRILQCEGASDFLDVFCVKSMSMLNNKQAWAVVRLWENLNGYDRYNICPFPNPSVVELMLNFKFNLCLCSEKRRCSNHCMSEGSRWDRLCRPCSITSRGQPETVRASVWIENAFVIFYICWGFIFVRYNSRFLLFSWMQAHIFQVL